MALLIDVIPSSNYPDAASRVFTEAGDPREISSITMPFGPHEGKPCDITGWSAEENTPCPAFCRRIEDSGDAFAYLVHGGSGGIRMKPRDAGSSWDTSNPAQESAPYFVMDSDRYISILPDHR